MPATSKFSEGMYKGSSGYGTNEIFQKFNHNPKLRLMNMTYKNQISLKQQGKFFSNFSHKPLCTYVYG